MNTRAIRLYLSKTLLWACLGVGAALSSGCATLNIPMGTANPPAPLDSPFKLLPILDLVDPFEPVNRKIAAFNDEADRLVIKPVAVAYRDYVPDVVRKGIGNFFAHYGDLWSAANAVLQLEPEAAAHNALRFGFNSVFGLYGVFDIAGELGVERHKKDLGQTLARWGLRSGPYIVLPILGPTTLRDAAVATLETKADIIRTFDNSDKRLSLYTLKAVDKRASLLRATAAVDDAALDKYSFTRDVYLQLRNNEIWDGNPPEDNKPASEKSDAGK